MVAYVVVIKERTTDAEQHAIYTSLAKKASAGHPMTIRALGGKLDVVEGPPAEAVAILEFPSFEEAKAWYESPAYQEALAHRKRSGDYRALILDGLA